MLGKIFSGGAKLLGKTAKVAGKGALAVGGGFLGGLGTGLVGGKLGGSGSTTAPSASQQQAPYPRISSIFAPTSMNTRVTGPQTIKDNCCCCDQTISLLSSIDETLKRSLYVSQAMNLAAKEKAAEGGDERAAGLGGKLEAIADSAEKTGFGIGEMVASTILLGLATNLGPILDYFKGNGNGQDKGIDLVGGAIGAGAGFLFGGKQKIATSALGAVTGSDALGKGLFYGDPKSTEGQIGGLVGNVGGGIAGIQMGAAVGAAGGPIGMFFGGLIGGIAGSFLLQDAGEALGDAIAGKFNENSEEAGKNIGKVAGEEINKSFKPSISSAGGNGFLNNAKDATSLMDLIGRIESGNNPDVYRKGGKAIYGEEISKLTISQVMEKQKTSGWDAVGKFQFIPETLKMLVGEMKNLGMLSGQEKFDEEMQNKIFQYQLSKMKNVQKFLGGDVSAKSAAMSDLAGIWAALPDPSTGRSKYEREGNRALTDIGNFSRTMDMALNKPELLGPAPKRDVSELERMALMRARPIPQVTPQASAPVVISNAGGQQRSRQLASIPSIDAPRILPKFVSQFESVSRYA